MNEERQQAEALDAFLNAYHEGEPVRPQTPEARLAADLVDLAASLEFAEPQPPANPSTTPPSITHLTEKEDRLMIAKRRHTTQSMSLPFVATLLLFLLIGVLVAPSISLPSLVPLASSGNAAPPVQEQPRLPIPVGGVVSGIDPTLLARMQDAGMEWAAFSLEYRQSDRDAILEAARTRIEGAHAEGFRAWITLSGGRSPAETGEAFTPEDGFELYAQTAGEIAALGADAIQIWAEPNLSLSWHDEQIDPANYVELLRLSSEAINAANPETLVVSAPPAPTSAQAAFGSDSIWNDDIYYQAMASLGAAEHIDCVGVRYNEGVVAPTMTEGDPRDNYPTRYFVPMIQRAAAAFRESRLPLCLSEYGYLAGEGELLPDGFEWAATTTVEQQAEWLAQGIQTAAELSSVRVQMAIIYRIDQTGETVWDCFAIIRPDGSCPACQAIAALKQ